MDTQMKSKNISAFTLAVGRTVNGIKTKAKKFKEVAPILTGCIMIGGIMGGAFLAWALVLTGMGLLTEPLSEVKAYTMAAQFSIPAFAAIGMLAEGVVHGKKYLDRASNNAAEQVQKEKRSLQNN